MSDQAKRTDTGASNMTYTWPPQPKLERIWPELSLGELEFELAETQTLWHDADDRIARAVEVARELAMWPNVPGLSPDRAAVEILAILTGQEGR